MSTIERLFTTTIAVTRHVFSNDSSAQVSQGNVSGHIQPASPNMVGHLGETFGTVFRVWCNKDADVETGDKLVISSGDYAGTYQAKAIRVLSVGGNPHMEVTCVKDAS